MVSGDDVLRAHQKVAPDRIEARSFEMIAELLPGFSHSRPEWPIIRRIVHTTGDPAIAHQIRVHPIGVEAGTRALQAGGHIICDVKMVAAGISRELMARFGCEVVCAIEEQAVLALACSEHMTRSSAAMQYLASRLPGAVVAIGNAPTALFAVLDYLKTGNVPPALIIGTPVGFVGAAEAKAELLAQSKAGVPYVTVEGTRGGSAIAVAVVNALLRLAAGE